MELIANILIAAGAGAATFYCFVLSRRLRQFTDLESGMGAAVAKLSRQVDQLNRALKDAQSTADRAQSQVSSQTKRAEDVSRRLELMLASMHDMDTDEGGAEKGRMQSW